MYQLRLAHDPARALSLAQTNWQIQREPIDARLLLAAAAAARQPEAARPVLDWMNRTGIEDVRLEAAVRALAAEKHGAAKSPPSSFRPATADPHPACS